jgi:predicted nucleotidyltransferase
MMDGKDKNLQETITDGFLQEMVKLIVTEVSPEMIILFGSRARNDVEPGSDIDLIIIENQAFYPGRSRRNEMEKIWRILYPFKIPKDILVYSRDELERYRNSLNHILGKALREGAILYERP